MDRRRRRAAPSYEEDMTPPRGMRGYRPEMSPAPEPPSYEEDMTPPPGMRGFNPRMEPAQETPRGPMRRMAKGGGVDIVGHGKTKAAAKADYARKMNKAGMNPKGMAKGGVTRADGCASRGKTKGRMI
jgi:hypothetical protein